MIAEFGGDNNRSVFEHRHRGYRYWHPISKVHTDPEEQDTIWVELSKDIDELFLNMRKYEQYVMEAERTEERIKYMKKILQLVEWGFIPNFCCCEVIK